VDLSRTDYTIQIESVPPINVEWTTADIVIEASTLANQGPKGEKGDKGDQGIQGNTGAVGASGAAGAAATIAVGSTTTGVPGSSAAVSNTGNANAAVFNFTIPRGDVGATGGTGAQGNPGSAATIAVGLTNTLAPGSNATVSNSGTSSAAVFNFGIPSGNTGATGSTGAQGNTGAAGAAATIAVGTTNTLSPGSSATVTNSGTSSAAIFSFGIPQGLTGAQGPTGPPGGASANTTLTALYTMPAIGSTAVASVANSGVFSVGGMVYISPIGYLQITALATNQLTLKNPGYTQNQASGSTAANGASVGGVGPPGPTAVSTDAGNTAKLGTDNQILVPGPVSGNASGTQVVIATDTRLSNTRTPTAHATTHITAGTDIIPAPTTTASGLVPALPASGGAARFLDGTGAFNQVAYGNVTGTPTSLAPTAHASTHLTAGSDPIALATTVLAGLCPAVDNTTIQIVTSKLSAVALAWTAITGKPTTFAPSAHASTHVTGGGDVLPAPTTTASGVVPVLPASGGAARFLDGTGAFNQVAYANVTGTPSSMTPTAHATTHKSGGSDAIALDTLAVPTDITTLNVSTTAHGLCPKAPNVASQVLLGTGVFGTLANASTSGAGLLATVSGNTTDYVTGANTTANLATAVNNLHVGRYYGTDTTNSTAYAVTVANDFSLTAGVVVWVTPTNSCNASPTLNVNSTGAKAIVNRANVALNQFEIMPQTFGVMYDGASWRVISPIGRFANVINPGGGWTVECAGFDWIDAYLTWSVSGSTTIMLNHVGYGVPINLVVYNQYSAALVYALTATSPTGAAATAYGILPSSFGGSALTNLGGGGVSVPSGYGVVLRGSLNASGTIMMI